MAFRDHILQVRYLILLKSFRINESCEVQSAELAVFDLKEIEYVTLNTNNFSENKKLKLLKTCFTDESKTFKERAEALSQFYLNLELMLPEKIDEIRSKCPVCKKKSFFRTKEHNREYCEICFAFIKSLEKLDINSERNLREGFQRSGMRYYNKNCRERIDSNSSLNEEDKKALHQQAELLLS
jgi:hypothetical protein